MLFSHKLKMFYTELVKSTLYMCVCVLFDNQIYTPFVFVFYLNYTHFG